MLYQLSYTHHYRGRAAAWSEYRASGRREKPAQVSAASTAAAASATSSEVGPGDGTNAVLR